MQEQKLEQKLKQFSQLMAFTAGTDSLGLSQVQNSVILVHVINLIFGLQCVDRNGTPIQYPEKWSEHFEGVYKFNYRLKNIDDSNFKLVQFRLIDNQEEGSLSVNFSVQNSEELHQIEIKAENIKNEEIIKKYMKYLQEKLKPQSSKKLGQQAPLLVPQWRTVVPHETAPRQPFPLLLPNQSNQPFNIPFLGNQYIGPDNEIFRGRGPNNPFGSMNSGPRLNDPRRPPGARYDPLDPFGSGGLDDVSRSRDFMGFNEFGQPFGGGRGGFNPGKFI